MIGSTGAGGLTDVAPANVNPAGRKGNGTAGAGGVGGPFSLGLLPSDRTSESSILVTNTDDSSAFVSSCLDSVGAGGAGGVGSVGGGVGSVKRGTGLGSGGGGSESESALPEGTRDAGAVLTGGTATLGVGDSTSVPGEFAAGSFGTTSPEGAPPNGISVLTVSTGGFSSATAELASAVGAFAVVGTGSGAFAVGRVKVVDDKRESHGGGAFFVGGVAAGGAPVF